MAKFRKHRKNPLVSTIPQRQYVKQMAKDLGIKLERKLMKSDYGYLNIEQMSSKETEEREKIESIYKQGLQLFSKIIAKEAAKDYALLHQKISFSSNNIIKTRVEL